MRIYIQVVTRSSRKEVKCLDSGEYKAWLSVSPVDGKANKQLIELLAKFFEVSKSAVQIVGGRSTKKKIIDIGGIEDEDA